MNNPKPRGGKRPGAGRKFVKHTSRVGERYHIMDMTHAYLPSDVYLTVVRADRYQLVLSDEEGRKIWLFLQDEIAP